MSGMVDGRRIGLVAGAALLLAGGMALSVGMNLPEAERKLAEEQQSAESNQETGVAAEQAMEMAVYPARGFSNMCGYEGKVYCGVNGIYGEEIAQKSSVFTVWEDKVYYVDKVQEAYDSVTDELLELKRAELNGTGEEVLADDVFLAGTGHEMLCGDKIFYGYEYDDNYRMRYACVDVNTGERKELPTDRIENVLGSGGDYLYYKGVDTETGENLLGRIHLEKGGDETLFTFAAVDEVGYIENVVMAGDRLYCLTLEEKTDSYDYRTYTYRIQIRNSKDGKVEKELPTELTGSANYSFLVEKDEVYVTCGGEIIAVSIETGETRTVAHMKAEEYWGILHFIPGDGYLYYEALAEENEETGNNDYFYRVPVTGGEPELIKEWFFV